MPEVTVVVTGVEGIEVTTDAIEEAGRAAVSLSGLDLSDVDLGLLRSGLPD